jgi:hypothetical protein
MMRFVLIIILGFFGLTAVAQTTGFRGKRTIVKTNLISGIRLKNVGLDLEYVTGRTRSVTLGVLASSYTPDAVSNVNGLYRIVPGATQSLLTTVGYRMYRNRIIPAPQGLYASIEIGVGFENHSLGYFEKITSAATQAQKASMYFHISMPTLGYQGVIGKRFLIDGKLATELNYVYEDGLLDYKFITSNLYSVRANHWIVGPAFYLKLGFLLF